MKFPFRRTKTELPLNTAEQMLANVFETCESDPNTVPLETLVSYSNYRKERYAIQRTVIILMLVLFTLLPLLFIAASVRVEKTGLDSSANPLYTVSVSTQIPIRQVQARMDGRNIPIYEIAPGEYQLQPRTNGEMNISVLLVNRQYTSVDIAIDGVDTQPPELLSSEAKADHIILYVSDSDSSVDYVGVTITDPYGNVTGPVGYDADAGYIILPYPSETLEISIPDIRGNALQVVLKAEGT